MSSLILMVLLGCTLSTAFILHPAKEEPASARCQGESIHTIRKALLGALGLQTEPRLPAAGLAAIREQWRTTYGAITARLQDRAAPAVHQSGADNTTGFKCCQMATQIFLNDLGWDNWVVYPESFTYVRCAACNPSLTQSILHCPTLTHRAHDTPAQMPCCQPTSQQMVPVVYMDEFSTMVISSVQLTRACGCGPGGLPLVNED